VDSIIHLYNTVTTVTNENSSSIQNQHIVTQV